ncbi:MAG: 1,4-dihydroxy-6-naphthoate synthase [Nitrospirae bacterium]|nr:1,4-dihydroxy-6-naphthoate synthase [Nitrospirota bacterium]
MRELKIAYSPCPNDTFIFYGLVHGLIKTKGLSFSETLIDIDALNKKALKEEFDVIKVSYHAFALLRDKYCLIRSGGAMGRGCGPLVVARHKCSMKDLQGKRIAIPGRLTTAYLLLELYDPRFKGNVLVMRFNEIMPEVESGEVDAGLIIHEGRFTYRQYGLKCVKDLGTWWEKKTAQALPLGAIAVRRSLGKDLIGKIQSLIRESVLYSLRHPSEPMRYIKRHSEELSDSVIKRHISLYVNDYSIDIGEEGIKAVREMFRLAGEAGLIKGSQELSFDVL